MQEEEEELRAAAAVESQKPRGGRGPRYNPSATHVFQRDDVGMLPVAQQDLHLLRRVPLGLVDDLEDNGSMR